MIGGSEGQFELIAMAGRLKAAFNEEVRFLSQKRRSGIEPEKEVLQIEAKTNGGKQSFGFPHCAEWRIRIDRPGPPPFEKVGHDSVDRRSQERMRLGDLVTGLEAARLAERLVEQVRRRQAGERPHVAKMCAEQPVEFFLVGGIKIVAVPPEPVASLGGVQLVPGSLGLLGREAWTDLQQARASVAQEIPPAVVLRMPDPDLVILIDPGSRVQIGEMRPLRRGCEGLGQRGGG